MQLVVQVIQAAAKVGISRAQLGTILGVTRQQIYSWESGRHAPRAAKIPKLRAVLRALQAIDRDPKLLDAIIDQPRVTLDTLRAINVAVEDVDGGA